MKQRIITSSFLACAAVMSWAAPIEFDFKDPKGVNNIVFRTDAPLESINGTGTGISGTVTFDPEHPGAVKGKIVLAVASLNVPNPKMKEHLHGPDWMNAAQHPEINFELAGTKNVKTEGDNSSVEAMGKLTIRGVTKELVVQVKMTYLKDKLKARQGREGDLLVIRANFSIKRSDFGINAAKFEEKVSDIIDLSLSLAGSAPRN